MWTGMENSLSIDEYGLVQLGDMRIGLVECSRVSLRRTNPRSMGAREYETLRKSVERFGFKSFVVVEELESGRFGIVDGHHRFQVAQDSGMERVPVVLLDRSVDGAWADMAMLTFNVSGAPISEVYVDLLSELTREFGAETTALFTAVEEKTLSSFLDELSAFTTPIPEVPTSTDAQTTPQAAWQGRPIVLELPRTPANVELIARARSATSADTDSQAVLEVLRHVFPTEEPTS